MCSDLTFVFRFLFTKHFHFPLSFSFTNEIMSIFVSVSISVNKYIYHCESHQNRLSGFGAVGGGWNLPFPIDLAIVLYTSLYTSCDVSSVVRVMCRGMSLRWAQNQSRSCWLLLIVIFHSQFVIWTNRSTCQLSRSSQSQACAPTYADIEMTFVFAELC